MNDEGVGVMSRSHDGDKGGLGGGLMALAWIRFEDEVTGTRYRMMWRSPVAETSFRMSVAESDFPVSESHFQNTSCRI